MTLVARGIIDNTKIQSLAERVKNACSSIGVKTTEEEFKCAASLASYGLLGPVDWLCLEDVDMTQVPEEKLIALVSSVTEQLNFGYGVTGSVWVRLLPHLRCETLVIRHQTLGREETQALVQLMEVGVKRVMCSDVTLDIAAVEYSGDGVCRNVMLWGFPKRHIKDVRSWAKQRNWRVKINWSENFVKLTK